MMVASLQACSHPPWAMHGCERSPSLGRTASALAYVVIATTGGYCYACPPPPPPPPPVASMHVLPTEVWGVPTQRFLIRARLTDPSGNLYPPAQAANVTWSSPDLTVEPPGKGATVVVAVPATGTGPFSLTAQFAGLPSVTIPVYTISASLSTSEIDVARAPLDPGGPPSLLLVDGLTTEFLNDTLVAFSGRGALDYLYCGAAKCGDIILFSRSQGLERRQDFDWTTRCDDVDVINPSEPSAACLNANALKVPAPPRPVVKVNYVVLTAGGAVPGESIYLDGSIGPPTNDVVGTIKADVEFARRVLDGTWSGLDLPAAATIAAPALTTSITVDLGANDPCVDIEAPVASQLSGVTFNPAIITVAYVEKIIELDGLDSSMRGLTCPWHPTYGSIVLVSWHHWGPTTLAHEFMHALGPWQKDSPWGHTEGLEGFTESNILWDYEADWKPAPRSWLTLGQAFRLSLDANGFFNRTATSFPSCQFYPTAIDPDTPCPRLSRDVIKP
jgi:hypothetical protein